MVKRVNTTAAAASPVSASHQEEGSHPTAGGGWFTYMKTNCKISILRMVGVILPNMTQAYPKWGRGEIFIKFCGVEMELGVFVCECLMNGRGI